MYKRSCFSKPFGTQRVNKKNTRTTSVTYSGVFTVDFEHISRTALVFAMLTLSAKMPAGKIITVELPIYDIISS